MTVKYQRPRQRLVAAQYHSALPAMTTTKRIDQNDALEAAPMFDLALDRWVNEGGAVYHAPRRRKTGRHELRE